MNMFSWLLSPIYIGYFIIPIISGIRSVVEYQLSLKQRKKSELWHILAPGLISMFFAAIFFGFIVTLVVIILPYAIFDYIISVLSCLLVSIFASEKIYIPPNSIIDSYGKAFRKGYTEGISRRLFSILPTKAIINIIYIIILIISHVITLYFNNFPIYRSDFFRFLEVNKYGIVIMYAFEKIIVSFSDNKEKGRIQILQQTSELIDKEEKQLDEKFKQTKQETRIMLKNYLQAKKELKKNKKNNSKS